MLSNTFIVSEFVKISYSLPTWSCVKMCHTVPRPVQHSNVSCDTTSSVFHLTMCYTVPQPVYLTWHCVMRYHDQCNLAICHTVSQPVNFTWQCVIRYHNQCISPGNVLYGTTTSAFHLSLCHALPRPVQPSNMSYGTTTSVFQLAMCYAVFHFPPHGSFTNTNWAVHIYYFGVCLIVQYLLIN
jgi:hypothetical protein